jgi:hypothetical protein
MAGSKSGLSTDLDPDMLLENDGENLLGSRNEEIRRPTTTGWVTLQRILGGTSSHQKSIQTSPSSFANVGEKLDSVLSGEMSPTQTLQFRHPTVEFGENFRETEPGNTRHNDAVTDNGGDYTLRATHWDYD